MKQGIQNGMNRVNKYVGQIELFVIVNSDGMKINVIANVKN